MLGCVAGIGTGVLLPEDAPLPFGWDVGNALGVAVGVGVGVTVGMENVPVIVVLVVLIVMSCCAAPPSDHDTNVCPGIGFVLIVCREPTIVVTTAGAIYAVPS